MGGCCGEQKVTVMVLSVDLQCCQCYRKIKKLLCKFLQIRNQVYDEKQNTVTITVVCCSPERIRDKLCAKGGKSIKSIDIKEPKKPKADDEPKTKKPAEQQPEKIQNNGSDNGSKKKPTSPAAEPKPKKSAETAPAPDPAPAEPAPAPPCRPVPPPQVYPVPVCCGSCYEGIPGGPCYHAGWRKPEKPVKPAPAPLKQPDPAPAPAKPAPAPPCLPGPPPQVYPVPMCCDSCYEGIPGGPCYQAGWRKPEKPVKPAPAPPKQPDPAPAPPCLPGPPPQVYPAPVCCDSCYGGIPGGPCYQAGWRKPEKPAKPTPAPPKQPDPAPAPPCLPGPLPQVYPAPACCDSCYEGIPGGPCYQGGYGDSYGRPPCQSGFGYGYGHRYNAYGSRCDYFSEENPSACSIM